MEKKLWIHEWGKRVNIGIFVTFVVDAWLMYRYALYAVDKSSTHDEGIETFMK